MKIRLTESVRYRSAEYPAGAVLDLSDRDAAEMLAAGHADAVPAAPAVKPAKPEPKE